VLERTIPLPDTKGRIDHLAVDLADRRLFVVEIANGTVDAIDLDTGKVIGRIVGLAEQQGVAWLPAEHELVVAFGDGSVHFYGTDLRELARIDLGNDADNVRVDPRNAHVLVGYGKGGLATIDAASGRTLSVRSTCGDADDLFLVRGHVLLICGTGYVEVIAANGDSVRVQTASGARTGLYVPELDRLFVAVPARGRPAAILAYRLNLSPS